MLTQELILILIAAVILALLAEIVLRPRRASKLLERMSFTPIEVALVYGLVWGLGFMKPAGIGLADFFLSYFIAYALTSFAGSALEAVFGLGLDSDGEGEKRELNQSWAVLAAITGIGSDVVLLGQVYSTVRGQGPDPIMVALVIGLIGACLFCIVQATRQETQPQP